MKEFLENLTIKQYEVFRSRVIYECCITRNTFANWKGGYPVAKRYQERINKIAEEISGEKIFNL